mgnify:CR=1 FL=1
MYNLNMIIDNFKHENTELQSSVISSPLPNLSYAKKQRTICKPISFSGIGLHSGKNVKMILHPAVDDSGYTFKIKNGPNSFIEIAADYRNVTSTKLCTTISNDSGHSISTTEHILSALYGLNIDNVIIELNANEIPVLDGSSSEFVKSIIGTGTVEQENFRKVIMIKKSIEVKDGNKIARVSPHNETMVTCEIEFDSEIIGHQTISLILNPDIYNSQISKARTFGFLEDVNDLRKNNLALGGSLENAIVISKNKILNKNGLRYNDEFVRHKALDLIGDISLAKFQIVGSIYSFRAGHDLNNKLLHKIFSSNENWEFAYTS